MSACVRACVRACMHACMYVRMYAETLVHAEFEGLKSMLGYLPILLSILLFDSISSLKPEVTTSARLAAASYHNPPVSTIPSPQRLGYRHGPPDPDFFLWVPRIPAQVLVFSQRAFLPPHHLPSLGVAFPPASGQEMHFLRCLQKM
jgi:hypothetical protein